MMNIHNVLHRPMKLWLSCQCIGRLFAALLMAAVCGAGPALSAPGGELDGSFGENGRLTTVAAYISYGRAIAQQPADGKILVAGHATSFSADGYDFAVQRLNPDGSSDNTFGSNGTTLVDFGGSDDFVSALALQPDGKIIVAGDADTSAIGRGRDFAILRLNPDGTIDSTFNGDGRVLLDLGGDDETIIEIALLPNGQLVVAGATNVSGNHDIMFARFEANGTLDTTFGTGQIAGTTLIDSNGKNDLPYEMIRQLDGKYVACGTSDGPGLAYNGNMLAVRVNTDGSIDTGFGVSGISLIETGRTFSGAQSCVAMTDGAIVLAGFHGEPAGQDPTLIRLTSDGRIDTSFGNSGVSNIGQGGIECVHAMILLNDGGLGITGSTSCSQIGVAQRDMFLARVDPDSGLLDASFGNQGVTIVDFGYADLESVAGGQGLIQQVDGKLVAVGTQVYEYWWDTSPAIALARVDLAGTGNAGFLGFSQVFAYVTEGTAEIEVSVRRTGGSIGDLSVDYNTHVRNAQEAQSPSDFTAASGTLSWASGDMDPKSIRIPITDDTNDEEYERFNIALSNSTTMVTLEYVVVGITDNDTPSPPPPPAPQAGRKSAGGGGAIGIDLLILLSIFAAFADRRRPRRLRDIRNLKLLDTVLLKS